MCNQYTVYELIFPDGKAYIGMTRQRVERRWAKGYGYKNQPVYKAILRYGWNNITHNIVLLNVSREEAQKAERKLIEQYKNDKGVYNVTLGGECGGDICTSFIINGKVYDSHELAGMSAINITSHDITTRINHHKWDIQKALTKEKVCKNKKYYYNGNKYTAKELFFIRKNKTLSYDEIRDRLYKGWDCERAITQNDNTKMMPSGIGDKKYMYNGELYNTYELSKMSKVIGITPKDIYDRVERRNWSVERALTQEKKCKNKLYLYHGELHTSLELAMLSPYNLSHHNITDRIRKGWTVEDAVNIPKQQANQKPS